MCFRPARHSAMSALAAPMPRLLHLCIKIALCAPAVWIGGTDLAEALLFGSVRVLETCSIRVSMLCISLISRGIVDFPFSKLVGTPTRKLLAKLIMPL